MTPRSATTGLVILFLSGLLLATTATAAGSDATPTRQVRFDIFRQGDNIGFHQVMYGRETDDSLEIHVQARIRVKKLFLTLYKLDHEALEIWSGAKIDAMRSKTRRNSRMETVVLEDEGESLKLIRKTRGDVEEVVLPHNILPSSFTRQFIWDAEAPQDYLMLDTLNGERKPVRLVPVDQRQLELPSGQIVDARYFELRHAEDDELVQEFWLSPDHSLYRIRLHTDGGDILDYQLAAI